MFERFARPLLNPPAPPPKVFGSATKPLEFGSAEQVRLSFGRRGHRAERALEQVCLPFAIGRRVQR